MWALATRSWGAGDHGGFSWRPNSPSRYQLLANVTSRLRAGACWIVEGSNVPVPTYRAGNARDILAGGNSHATLLFQKANPREENHACNVVSAFCCFCSRL